MAALIADFVIVMMLAGGIVYAAIVHRRVKRLMALLHELGPTVQEFSQAVDKSEHSVARIQHTLSQTLAEESAAEEDHAPASEPLFTTGRVSQTRDLGVRVIRNKQELVRRFFEVPRGERRV